MAELTGLDVVVWRTRNRLHLMELAERLRVSHPVIYRIESLDIVEQRYVLALEAVAIRLCVERGSLSPLFAHQREVVHTIGALARRADPP